MLPRAAQKPSRDREGTVYGSTENALTVIIAAECGCQMDVRKFSPSADQVGKTLIFNLGGNNYRLPCCVSWELRRLFFRSLLTHAGYDRVNVEDLYP